MHYIMLSMIIDDNIWYIFLAFKVFKNKHYNHKCHVYLHICVRFLTIWKVWPVRLDSEAMFSFLFQSDFLILHNYISPSPFSLMGSASISLEGNPPQLGQQIIRVSSCSSMQRRLSCLYHLLHKEGHIPQCPK